MPQLTLHPQDVVVLAKVLSNKGVRLPLARIAADLSLSASQVHASLKRLERCRLVLGISDGGRPLAKAVEEFLVHGLKYVFPSSRGEITRGMPTSHAAPPLNQFVEPGTDPPPVWPTPEGKVRGASLEPLHKVVPIAASRDQMLYQLLTLIDALRDGRARERELAERELGKLLRFLLHG